MSNFFNMDNAFFSTVSKIMDIIVLSVIWSLFCIPIITIGPATTAMYYAMVKVVRRERGYLLREFFRSFKANFKYGAILSVLLVIGAFVLYIDYQYANMMIESGKKSGYVYFIAFNVITLIAILTLMLIFPVLSRFTLTFKQLLKNSFLMAMRHFPTTLLLTIIVVAFGLGIYLLLPYPTFFLFPGMCCLLCSFLIERVFKRYMPKPEETPEESGRDSWYLE